MGNLRKMHVPPLYAENRFLEWVAHLLIPLLLELGGGGGWGSYVRIKSVVTGEEERQEDAATGTAEEGGGGGHDSVVVLSLLCCGNLGGGCHPVGSFGTQRRGFGGRSLCSSFYLLPLKWKKNWRMRGHASYGGGCFVGGVTLAVEKLRTREVPRNGMLLLFSFTRSRIS